MSMSEEHQTIPEALEQEKAAKLLAFWYFGTVLIVFAAITALLFFVSGSIGQAIRFGLPMWGITAVAAALIYAGYYYLRIRKTE